MRRNEASYERNTWLKERCRILEERAWRLEERGRWLEAERRRLTAYHSQLEERNTRLDRQNMEAEHQCTRFSTPQIERNKLYRLSKRPPHKLLKYLAARTKVDRLSIFRTLRKPKSISNLFFFLKKKPITITILQ